MTDSERMPLEGLRRTSDHERRHKFFRFDPTVSSGTLIQLVVLALGAGGAYATYRSDQTQINADIAQLRISTSRDRDDVKAAVDSFRSELKELKSDVKDVNTTVIELKAQASINAKNTSR